MPMFKPINVKALPNYKIWLEYSNGVVGEVDLSDLVNKGVFQQLQNRNLFDKVHIGLARQIAWNDSLELCADALYLKITEDKPENLFPSLRKKLNHA